jgi:DNA-binding CsgD family transcriptional regulator
MKNLFGLLSPLWDFYARLPEGVLLLDHQHKLQYFNHTANRILNLDGLTYGTGIGKKIITTPDLETPDFMQNLKAGQRKCSGIALLDNGNGYQKESHYQCYCITDDVTNEHLGKIIFFRDPELPDTDYDFFGQRTELLHALNGCTSEMVLVLDLLRQNNLFVNDYVQEILGWSASEIMDGGWAFGLSIIHPDDISLISTAHKDYIKLLQNTETNTGMSYSCALRLRSKSGGYIKMNFTGSTLERDENKDVCLLLYFARPELENGEQPKFTPREIEIARMLVQGKSSKMIAAKYSLSIHTVNGYRAQLMKKTGVTNAAALVNYLIENKLL